VEFLQRPLCQAEVAPGDATHLNTQITYCDERRNGDGDNTTITGVVHDPDSRFAHQQVATAIAITLEAPHLVRYQSVHSSHALEH
jgi:hypothetical protein